eukprot:COSAG02_NODE_391_length_23237_cov_42.467672_8_plen_93_part_00
MYPVRAYGTVRCRDHRRRATCTAASPADNDEGEARCARRALILLYVAASCVTFNELVSRQVSAPLGAYKAARRQHQDGWMDVLAASVNSWHA